jgi:hypothetical protein
MLQRLCGINYYTYQLQPSFLLFLGFPNSSFPLGFLTKIIYRLLISTICATPSNKPHPSWHDHLNCIRQAVQTKKFLTFSLSWFKGFQITLLPSTLNVCSLLAAKDYISLPNKIIHETLLKYTELSGIQWRHRKIDESRLKSSMLC